MRSTQQTITAPPTMMVTPVMATKLATSVVQVSVTAAEDYLKEVSRLMEVTSKLIAA